MQLETLTPQEFIDRYRLLIADADGTLRRCTVPGQPCPNKPGEWEAIPEAKDWISAVKWHGYEGPYFGIASNQGGIDLGLIDRKVALDMLFSLRDELGIPTTMMIGAVRICPTTDKTFPDRKPNPGMLLELMRMHDVKPEKALMVGDREDDRAAAEKAGCDFIWAWDLFGFEPEAPF
jgi:D-glycero-D-manno-heptose 1,7-bisphosphate phosphatase